MCNSSLSKYLSSSLSLHPLFLSLPPSLPPFYPRSRDFYHTCYCLSGLSIAQHCYGNKNIVNICLDSESILVSLLRIKRVHKNGFKLLSLSLSLHTHTHVQKPTHPAFNIVADKVQSAYQYFSKLPSPHLIHKDGKTESQLKYNCVILDVCVRNFQCLCMKFSINVRSVNLLSPLDYELTLKEFVFFLGIRVF